MSGSDYYIKQIRFNSVEEITLIHALAYYRARQERDRDEAGLRSEWPRHDGAQRSIDRIDTLLGIIRQGEHWEVEKSEAQE
jgi:hypothetical protein